MGGSFNVMDMMKKQMQASYRVVDPHSGGADALKIKFKDVAGLHEAKLEVQEFMDYLKSPDKYTRLGAKLPKGALLLGPPGCGKTLLAKALAAESTVPFINMNGTEFVEMIGGLGASRIRDLFKEAKSRAPCIIYIDEIDAIGSKRSDGGGSSGSASEQEHTLNQLLVEMDGMDSAQGVIVLGSTNRAEVLDAALLRRGRFDRHITIDYPTLLDRKEIFELYLKQIKLKGSPSDYADKLARMTPGFTGADINNVINEGAIRAANLARKLVTVKELDYAIQKVLAGPEKRSHTMAADEKRIVAYHESGHALVGWLLKHTDALVKVSIVPRTSSALGFAQYSPADRKLFSKEELFDRMCMTLGGRAAENITFGSVTTGAEDDLRKVTKIAYDQVKNYGMSEVIGPLSFSAPPGEERNALFMKKPYSKQTQHLIDSEASGIVSSAYFATEDLLRNNKEKLEVLAQNLLNNDVLSYDDVQRLIGPPPHGEKTVVEIADHVLPTPVAEERSSDED